MREKCVPFKGRGTRWDERKRLNCRRGGSSETVDASCVCVCVCMCAKKISCVSEGSSITFCSDLSSDGSSMMPFSPLLLGRKRLCITSSVSYNANANNKPTVGISTITGSVKGSEFPRTHLYCFYLVRGCLECTRKRVG